MWNPRHLVVTLLLGLLAASLMFGCRAWEPEAVIVNRPPQIYIVGSPAETSGAYFHFRVFWYGTDEDGYVDRYVWALTDTSIQDRETDEDEEDERFNPATNISTLSIGRYTTRTDTVFDFRINQGAELNYNMTLHMVAIDDRGAFSRRPARLNFFSNALGNPRIRFYRDEVAAGNEFANYDTVGFGKPLFLRWSGSTPNIAGYDPAMLALIDTVNPAGMAPDGLLGYKWRLPQLDNCNPAVTDCWQPRRFSESLGDSFSYFGNLSGLSFLNDGTGQSVFERRHPAGVLLLLVNTIDVAGVEVPAAGRALNIVINYDPDTYILRGETDWQAAHNDPLVYPVYTVFHGPERGTYSFVEGDTVPDRAYVLFKAMGWDDARDTFISPNNRLTFQGEFIAGQFIRGGSLFFSFQSGRSDTHSTQEWTAAVPSVASADTIGFQVGPFDYRVIMRSVDEHLTRDGTPDTFRFVANYPPCVQCIEVGNINTQPGYTYEDDCYDAECLDEVPALRIYSTSDARYNPAGDPTILSRLPGTPADTIYVRPAAGAMTFTRPANPDDWFKVASLDYYYLIYLHGKDHVREHWPTNQAHRRIAAWRYEVNYQGDERNVIKDGSGADDLQFLSGFNIADNVPDPTLSDFYILPESGVWGLRVKVPVPQWLMLGGPVLYWSQLIGPGGFNCPPYPSGGTEEEILAWQANTQVQLAYRTFRLTTMQLTPGSVDAIAADQSRRIWRDLTNCYNYYSGTRTPDLANPRNCGALTLPPGVIRQGSIDLFDFNTFSNKGQPVRKEFDLALYRLNETEPFYGNQDPPNWISNKSARGGWR
jgi:hypothetical protein